MRNSVLECCRIRINPSTAIQLDPGKRYLVKVYFDNTGTYHYHHYHEYKIEKGNIIDIHKDTSGTSELDMNAGSPTIDSNGLLKPFAYTCSVSYGFITIIQI